ncbi:MAG: hypothetical protein WBN57_01530 [Gammaproteobacteria bacterium]|jgi:hypothetical protein
MEEQEYKNTYQTVNKRRCVYEKAINSRRCGCASCHRFNLADREGVACKTATGNALCTEFLNTLRSKARFSLHLTHSDKPLPHAKETRVQTGGLLGLQELLDPVKAGDTGVKNIIGLLDAAILRYERLQTLPYDIIMQSVVSFEGRKKRQRSD